MADNKTYYYMRLKEGFFDDDAIKIIEARPDGYLYSNILLKLYLKSLKFDGRLMYKGRIPYNPEVLATITGHQVGTVEKALKLFKELDLIEILDNGAIYMLDIQSLIGKSSTEADRKREYRARIDSEKAQLLEDGQMSGQMSGQMDLEIELEIEKEKEIDNNTICSELESSKPEIFIALPLVTSSGFFDVTFSYLNSLRELYPAVDVEQEFRNMRGWLDSNPTKRKTARGIKRFITGWLAREQDKPHYGRGNTYGTAGNRNMSTDQYMESTAGWNN